MWGDGYIRGKLSYQVGSGLYCRVCLGEFSLEICISDSLLFVLPVFVESHMWLIVNGVLVCCRSDKCEVGGGE